MIVPTKPSMQKSIERKEKNDNRKNTIPCSNVGCAAPRSQMALEPVYPIRKTDHHTR